MSSVLKSLAMNVPAYRNHMKRVQELSAHLDQVAAERDRLAIEVRDLREVLRVSGPAADVDPQEGWAETKRRKKELSNEIRSKAATSRLTLPIEPTNIDMDESITKWIRHQVDAEGYWFQKIEVLPGVFSTGWSDPAAEKLPYYGLPEDLTGKRVLDIGCAEGFFSFEAERRGAREVIGIDSFPDSIRRFNITKAARQSNASAFLMNVYDLEPKRLGTFDVVLFYGVFYHLKHPQYGLERIRSICTGDLLFQTHMYEEPSLKGTPWARFYPHGMMSGSSKELFDPTVFWIFNSACCLAMLDHVGFTDLKIISTDPNPFVISARSPLQERGCPPDQTEAPWC
jgi:tRNA (mo5U34)-methyltransferase